MRRMMIASLALFASITGCGGVEDSQSNEEGVGEVGQVEALLWTGTTSEEYPPLICDSGYLINGAECSGGYCDNIRVNCTNAGVAHGASYWTTTFSEEGTSYRQCGANEWVTGISCRGSSCDNVALECTAISGRTVGGCAWSAWITDGSGPWNAPAGYYARGAQCSGSYCDNMRFYYCRLN